MPTFEAIYELTEAPWFIPASVVLLVGVAWAFSMHRTRARRRLRHDAEIESRLRN